MQSPLRFEVTFTPMDRFGNLLSPTGVGRQHFISRDMRLLATQENPLDATHRLVVTLLAGDARPKGKSGKTSANATFEGAAGPLEVERGESLNLVLEVSGQMLQVSG